VYGAGLALLIVVLLTPAVGGMARMLGVVDQARRPIPRLGGLALFLGIFVPALAFLDLNREMRGLLLGMAVATTVGAIDDFRGLRWWEKLTGQVIAAAIPTGFGIWIHRFTFPVLGVHQLPDWLGVPLTVAGIVAVMNMVNFIDGVDGLAAGVCTIAGITFAVIALSLDRNAAGVLAMLTAGAALGYLRHGFHPASIFLGDSGSNLLGYMLASVAVQGALKTNAVIALVFPLVILAVPILDSSFVVAKRIKHGKPVHVADRWHFHHRFANIGFSQRRTVVYLYGWTIALAALALALRFVPYSDNHGHFDVGWTLALVGFAIPALVASVYLVLVLEILKLKRFRQFQLRRARMLEGEPPPEEAEVDAGVAHELETGEFEIVDLERER
jgi:UDP-GlcNAc:undecaprenyl-phosphate/decaprenyl-phosphate GlcNAc-1-phosphate transferase